MPSEMTFQVWQMQVYMYLLIGEKGHMMREGAYCMTEDTKEAARIVLVVCPPYCMQPRDMRSAGTCRSRPMISQSNRLDCVHG